MKRPSSVGVASGPATQGQRRSAWWLIAGLLVLAFNLRLIFPSLAVLLPQITRAAGLSSAAAGYLTTLPVVCMGVFAPLAPLCARRVGLERTLLAVVALLACGTALRGLAGVGGLFIGTAVAGAAIAVANVLLPALVKRDFPAHVATMTAMYIVAMYVGASLVAAGTVPLLQRWHAHWPTGLALCALPAAIATLLWLPKLWRQGPSTVRALPRVRGLARDPLAWQVTFFMGLQSAMAYIAAGWVAPILQSRGLSPTQAGWITSVVMFATIAGGLSAPPLLRRCRDQRRIDAILSVVTGCALLGLLLAPVTVAWLCAAVEGWGSGCLFAVALTVIVLRSPDAAVAAQMSSMAQTVGYIVAASGPLLVGLLLDWTGGFAMSAWLFAVIAGLAAVSGWGAGRQRYVRTS